MLRTEAGSDPRRSADRTGRASSAVQRRRATPTPNRRAVATPTLRSTGRIAPSPLCSRTTARGSPAARRAPHYTDRRLMRSCDARAKRGRRRPSHRANPKPRAVRCSRLLYGRRLSPTWTIRVATARISSEVIRWSALPAWDADFEAVATPAALIATPKPRQDRHSLGCRRGHGARGNP